MYDDSFEATVLGIDGTGSLIVKNDEGQVLHINTGEIFAKPQVDI
jgi:biotin-(acetyl-CoA carboxylase) ligase